ncbi:MAG: protein-glutamate O-methyltransferase CheR [Acidimicrobiales bacterium]
MSLSEADFTYIRQIVRAESAISLDVSKSYLVEARLKPIMREQKLGSFDELVSLLRRQQRGPLVDRVIDAMTTNETSWLRDAHPFDVLIKSILPDLANKRGNEPIQIWSAACSSGQEPYSIAMLVAEHLPHLQRQVKIFATDLSTEMLAKAKEGSYTQLEVNRGMPAPMLMRHFNRAGTHWQVKPELKAMIQFRQHNLDQPFTGIPTSDVVLMRNVLIYFESDVKRSILEKVRKVLRPDGHLILGASETTVGVDASWRRELISKTSIYRPS